MGPEPAGKDVNANFPNYDNRLGYALNWYNYMHDEKKAREYILSFLKRTKAPKKMVDAVKASSIIASYGWMARLVDCDAILSGEHLARLETYLKGLVAEREAAPTEPAVVKTKRVPDAPAYMGEVDGAIDDMLEGKSFDLDKFFELHNVPAMGRKNVIALLKKYAKEFEDVNEDPELKEGFYRPVRLNRVVKSLKAMIEKTPVRKTRKVRVKKMKAPKLDKVKYMDKYNGIESLSPVKIVGARKAWLYKPKFNEVVVLLAGAELSIKGSTIIGYDEKASYKMKVRNAVKVVQRLLAKDDKVLAEIKTNRRAASGRLSESVIILRVE
jgi:hypothetical protein